MQMKFLTRPKIASNIVKYLLDEQLAKGKSESGERQPLTAPILSFFPVRSRPGTKEGMPP
jgi:hypothetical protein